MYINIMDWVASIDKLFFFKIVVEHWSSISEIHGGDFFQNTCAQLPHIAY